MQFGICVPSHVGDIDYIVRAEELGYSHAWLADSQMIWSDCYACLALAAQQPEAALRLVGRKQSGPPEFELARIETWVAEDTLGSEYLAARREGVAAARAENARALEGFLTIPHKRAMEIARTEHLFSD